MRNSYPGTCFRCGGHVPAGKGHFERRTRAACLKWPGKPLPKWLTQHADCAIEFRGTNVHHRFAPAVLDDLTRDQRRTLKRGAAMMPPEPAQ